ncbi:MAG: hypothetical protein GC186_00460 [Rhodobacteraceae bacterium]|nr:hypothetical protein [Paracoccaceae bacterium]
MPKYLFAYHGGSAPTTPEDGKRVMQIWETWFTRIGAGVIDGGAPVGQSTTITPAGVTANGGANPVSGYSIFEAADHAAAVKLAQSCPILANGGNVEIAPVMQM